MASPVQTGLNAAAPQPPEPAGPGLTFVKQNVRETVLQLVLTQSASTEHGSKEPAGLAMESLPTQVPPTPQMASDAHPKPGVGPPAQVPKQDLTALQVPGAAHSAVVSHGRVASLVQKPAFLQTRGYALETVFCGSPLRVLWPTALKENTSPTSGFTPSTTACPYSPW